MTRRKDGGPATPYRLRRRGFVLEREHVDLGADTYHDFVFLGDRTSRDWLGRVIAPAWRMGTSWLVLRCNNPDCPAIALRRARALEAETNHALLAWHPDYGRPLRRDDVDDAPVDANAQSAA